MINRLLTLKGYSALTSLSLTRELLTLTCKLLALPRELLTP